MAVDPTKIKSLLVTPTELTLQVGNSAQFTATAIDSTGATSDVTATATWTSLNPAVATVDAGGLVTAVADGTAGIQADSDGFTTSVPVAVDVTLTALVISPNSAQVTVGQTQQFTATGTYSDTTTEDLSDAVDWDSTTAAGTINATGLATGLAAGAAGITARTSTMVAGATLNVIAAASTTPSPCDLYQKAQAQLFLLSCGQQTVVVETPGLGRVEFARGSIGDLQRMVDLLAQQCAASQGQTVPRRRPISIEAWP